MSSGYGGDHIKLKSLSINDHYYFPPQMWIFYWFDLKTVIFVS